MAYEPVKEPRQIEVGIYMTSWFLKRIDDHLKAIGMRNRSAWVRAACIKHMNEEAAELREEEGI